MFLTGLIGFIVAVMIIVAICRATFFVLKLSVIFSKVSVALVIALAFSSSVTLVPNGFLNYVIWAAICIAACFLLCKLPRIDCALEFFCKTMVSYVVGWMLVDLLINSILKLNLTFGWDLAVEIGIKLTVLLVSGASLYQKFIEVDMGKFSNVIVVNFDRLVAALLYGFSCGVIAIGNLPVAVSGWVSDLVLIGSIVLAFVLDCIFTGKRSSAGAAVS